MNHEQQSRGGAFYRVCHYAPGLASLLHYQSSWLGSDIAAGLSVAAIALPVGIAYSDLAGVPAVIGMYSAIFPLLAYALFGSSRQLMTGPDAATCIIVAASLGPLAGGDTQLYLALMVVLTLMTGILYIIGGVARLGFIANFLSQPILAGYLNGIALIIITGQLPKLCGYTSSTGEIFSQWIEFVGKLSQAHPPTLVLGLSLLVAMVVLRRLSPRLPAALLVVVAGIVAVVVLGLHRHGVAILGPVPAGLPVLHLAPIEPEKLRSLFVDAAGITLVSFTSGVLTAKSFARLNRYDINANQELIAFGAANLAAGIAQGFPVTGADSRTAVNNAMGGKSQMAGIVAAAAMLVVLFFLTDPLGYVPITALAAVIMVSAVGLFDFATLRDLYRSSRRELLLSVITTLGVLLLGVLHGVLLAVVLSLLWLLAIGSRPHDAVLGRVAGIKGFHDITDYPGAITIPGLILYRFDANLVFFNADYFRERVRSIIAASDTPVEWFVVDASAINVVDITAIQKIDELRGGTRSARHPAWSGPREAQPDAVFRSGVGARSFRTEGHLPLRHHQIRRARLQHARGKERCHRMTPLEELPRRPTGRMTIRQWYLNICLTARSGASTKIIDHITFIMRRYFLVLLCTLPIAGNTAAVTFQLPPADVDVVGQVEFTEASREDTLLDIARRYDIGQNEILLANPKVDRWLPEDGAHVTIPNRYILPRAERNGLVLNLPEMRLYYYPKPVRGQQQIVITHPVSVGRMDWVTPLGTTKIIAKERDPSWRPPKSLKEEHAKEGDILPDVVPPGPDNPLGRFAMRLGFPGYLIHSTNKPFGVGMRVSHGCIRMYPEDIERLFDQVPVGTQIQLVNQPIKVGWLAGALFIEVHPPMDEDKEKYQDIINAAFNSIADAIAGSGNEQHVALSGSAIKAAVEEQSGIPVMISK